MRIGILSAELGREDVHENKRLIREIRLKGHRPKIINYRKTVVVTTKNKSILYQPDDKGVLHQVRVDVVIPRINEADEKSLQLATLALECLMASGVCSTADPRAVRLAKNKIRSLVALAGAGLPVPRSAAITGIEEYEIDIDRTLKIVEPNAFKRLIIKTNTGTHGKGVMPVSSRGQARALVEGLLANSIPLLIQQFVEPSKKNQYIDLRFIVVNGRVVASMKRASGRKDEIRANISLGGKGIPHLPSIGEIEIAEKAAKAVGLSIAGVDIIPSNSKRVVIEVNTSPGFVVEDITGINIARKIAQQAVSQAVRDEKRRGRESLVEKLGVDKLPLPPKLVTMSQIQNMPMTIKSLGKFKSIPKIEP